MIKFILLGFLNYGPMAGYDLKQAIDGSSAHFWHAHHSQIYTTLRKMEDDGLVTSCLVQAEGGPDRRVYTVTSTGHDALRTWLDQPLTHASPVKEELLVRLFFSARRDPHDVLAELRVQSACHRETASVYEDLARRLPDPAPKEPGLERDHTFWHLTLEMGRRYEAMYLAWLDHAIRTIESL
jgi:PadR family transcriptional regulator, regulatory protein AphA